MLAPRLEQGNRQRLDRLMAAVNRLPDLERARWKKRIVRKLKQGPQVQVGGEWNPTEPTDGSGEWDLELANWLDAAYQPVADRAEEVWTNTRAGVENAAASAGRAASSVGFGLWPLAIGAAVVLLAFGSAKRSR